MFGLNVIPINTIFDVSKYEKEFLRRYKEIEKNFDTKIEKEILETFGWDWKTNRSEKEIKKIRDKIQNEFTPEFVSRINQLVDDYWNPIIHRETSGAYNNLEEIYKDMTKYNAVVDDPEVLDKFALDWENFEKGLIHPNEIKEKVENEEYPKGHPFYKLYPILKGKRFK